MRGKECERVLQISPAIGQALLKSRTILPATKEILENLGDWPR